MLITWLRLIHNNFASDAEWMIDECKKIFFRGVGKMILKPKGTAWLLISQHTGALLPQQTSSVITTLLIKRKHYMHRISIYRSTDSMNESGCHIWSRLGSAMFHQWVQNTDAWSHWGISPTCFISDWKELLNCSSKVFIDSADRIFLSVHNLIMLHKRQHFFLFECC